MQLIYTTLLLGGALLAPVAHSADFRDYQKASNQKLDSMRGGYIADVGGKQLLLSLGIEHVTFINGELATATPLSGLPIQLIQNGTGNSFTVPSTASLAPETVALIQNSLDNQVIHNMTIINATLATKDMIHSQSLSLTLGQSRSYSQH